MATFQVMIAGRADSPLTPFSSAFSSTSSSYSSSSSSSSSSLSSSPVEMYLLKKISEILCDQYFGIRCVTMMDGKLEGQICTQVREQSQSQSQAQMRDAIGALR